MTARISGRARRAPCYSSEAAALAVDAADEESEEDSEPSDFFGGVLERTPFGLSLLPEEPESPRPEVL
jgi:hypothetical protein